MGYYPKPNSHSRDKVKTVLDLSNYATYVLNTKTSEVENKIPNHDKYITTTPEFNKWTAENFAAKLQQVNSVTETHFDNTLISLNKRITSNKTFRNSKESK